MFYVYLLQSGAHRYIGSTNDLRKRLAEHNSGQNQSTKAHMPWRLIYYEAHTARGAAERRESYFKTSPGRRALYKIVQS